MHRTTVARATAAAAIVTAAMLASGGVASAGKPLLQACVGTTFSTAAIVKRGDFRSPRRP